MQPRWNFCECNASEDDPRWVLLKLSQLQSSDLAHVNHLQIGISAQIYIFRRDFKRSQRALQNDLSSQLRCSSEHILEDMREECQICSRWGKHSGSSSSLQHIREPREHLIPNENHPILPWALYYQHWGRLWHGFHHQSMLFYNQWLIGKGTVKDEIGLWSYLTS